MRDIVVVDPGVVSLVFPASSIKGASGAIAAALSEEGSLVSGAARRRPWSFESIEEGGGETSLTGPGFSGRSLDSARGVEDGLGLLLEAAKALEYLSREGGLKRGVSSTGILVGPEGEVLVLPAQSVARALSARSPQERSAAAARLVHPRSESAEADAAFLLAQAAYRFASGTAPFPREAAEAGSSAPPSPPVLAAALAAPALDPALVSVIDRTFADPGSLPLIEWRKELDEAARHGWLRVLRPEEEAEIGREKAARLEKAAKKEALSTFMRKRGALVGGIAGGLALAALVVVSTIQARNDGPSMIGRSPIQVAEAYYQGLSGLDIETLEAAGDPKAKEISADSTMVTNLFILTKTRLAYEGIDTLARAGDWLAAGRPPLDSGKMLFGVTGLELKEESASPSSESGSSRSIRALYSLWYMERSGDEIGAELAVIEEKREDDLRLELTKKGWRIVGLERRRR